MKIGEQVLFYTHESSDQNHTTVDHLSFVLRAVDDNIVDIVTFPPGGPTTFTRVRRFDPKEPGDVTGLSYFRPVGEKAPDFAKAFAHVNTPDWSNMVVRHREELARNPVTDQEPIKARHLTERKELKTKLEQGKPSDMRTDRPYQPEPNRPDYTAARPPAPQPQGPQPYSPPVERREP